MNFETVEYRLTNRCNLACRHCAVEAGPNGNGVLSSSLIYRTLEEAKELGFSSYKLSGGEPFLEFGTVKKAIQKGTELGMVGSIITNGVWKSQTGPAITSEEDAKDIIMEISEIVGDNKLCMGVKYKQIPRQDIH